MCVFSFSLQNFLEHETEIFLEAPWKTQLHNIFFGLHRILENIDADLPQCHLPLLPDRPGQNWLPPPIPILQVGGNDDEVAVTNFINPHKPDKSN